LAIIACAGRITMDADCLGHVGLVAGAGYPIPYEAISRRHARWPGQKAYGKTEICWRHCAKPRVDKPSDRMVSR
jgi:hypothetical protein